MTLDQLQRRDERIAGLEALGRRRTREQEDLLGRLYSDREQQWRRLPAQIERARRRAAELATYARQIGFPFTTTAQE